ANLFIEFLRPLRRTHVRDATARDFTPCLIDCADGTALSRVAFALRMCASYRLSRPQNFSSCIELPGGSSQTRSVDGHCRSRYQLAAHNHLGQLVQITTRRIDPSSSIVGSGTSKGARGGDREVRLPRFASSSGGARGIRSFRVQWV